MDHRCGTQALELRPAGFTEAAACDLARVRGPATVETYRAIAGEPGAGLLDVVIEGERVATVVYRFDTTEYGLEFVIVAAAGGAPGVDLVARVLPDLETFALVHGCQVVRFHTDRGGLLRKARRQGYGVTELVFRKALGTRH